MADAELEELRKKVKEQETKKKIEDEKIKLREKLKENLPSSKLMKVGKKLFKKLVK